MEVHRCRFVPYPPAAINALAFSHSSPTTADGSVPDSLRLAVGRANGDIEIWNPLRGAWFHESTFKGGRERSIEGLVWTQDPEQDDGEGRTRAGQLRLFSIGYSTEVTEWDLSTGHPARHCGESYGEIWCIAAQPRRSTGAQSEQKDDNAEQSVYQDLVVGCSSGTVVLLSTEDGDLKFKRFLNPSSTKKARVLSIAFRDAFTVIAGCADSSIRVLDTRSARLIRNVALGAGPLDAPRETLVWAVRALPNGDIVSGDSTGEVRFWDGTTWTLSQRLKGHQADILDLEVSADGKTVISGGMDRRTTIYKRGSGGRGDRRSRWSTVTHRRLHSHDIKAMASFDSKTMSVVVSGGLDTNLIVMPLREFGRENHRTITSLPQLPPLQSAPDQRLLASWWEREVRLWKFPLPSGDASVDQPDAFVNKSKRPQFIARMGIKGEENITSLSLSSCGSLLAVSTAAQVKLFRLGSSSAVTGKTVRIRKVDLPVNIARLAARLVVISPDSRWLCIVTPKSQVYLARMVQEGPVSKKVQVLSQITKLKRIKRGDPSHESTSGGALDDYEHTINRVAFSADSRILVAADLSGHLDSWVCQGYEDPSDPGNEKMNGYESSSASSTSTSDSDSEDEDPATNGRTTSFVMGQRWVRNPSALLIPTLPAAALILSFRPIPANDTSVVGNGVVGMHPTRHNPHPHSHDVPIQDDRLFIMTADHNVYEMEMVQGQFSSWSRRNPTSCLPSEFRGWRDRAMGCFWDVEAGRERIWIYGSSWLCMFDLLHDYDPEAAVASTKTRKRKRKRTEDADDDEDDEDGLRKHTSGAGSKVPTDELSVALRRKMRKFEGPNAIGAAMVVTLDPHTNGLLEDEEEAQMTTDLELVHSRRETQNNHLTNGMSQKHEDDIKYMVNHELAPPEESNSTFWSTHRYRSILGIMPIGRAQADHLNKTGLPQVALVERPSWDLDLPPRYYGDQDRD
ncbi:MAG: U3 small nucleolar RNA-associated protein [Watsoniomyces obsoletus]|nr:MAG: U3 small nucleolar RNA-associated protein [Watsoniomyces obsoletus]